MADAKIVLALGSGVQGKEHIGKLQSVADALGAEIGASRPVVMGAWTDMHRLIGISGHMLSSEICIAAGVSGSAAFCSGIRDCRLLVAINSDRQAAIFELADVGIVDDLFAVLFALEEIIRQEKHSEASLQAGKQRCGG